MNYLLRNCYLKNKVHILQGEDSMSIIACLNGLIALVGSERTLIPVSDSTTNLYKNMIVSSEYMV
jgi:hypothetical protein